MGRSDANNVWDLLREATVDAGEAAVTLARFIHENLREHLLGECTNCCFMLREAMEPSEAIDVVVRDYIAPYQLLLTRHMAAVAPSRTAQEHALSASSVLGQILHYRIFRPFIERVRGVTLNDEAQVRQIALHIARFSLQGLGCDEELVNQALARGVRPASAVEASGKRNQASGSVA